MTSQCIRVALVVLLLGHASQVLSEDWTRFRGPNGSGISADSGFPEELDAESNLKWKTPVPPGKSSPVLTSQHLFLTAHEGEKRLTLCVDRLTGQVLWQRSLTATLDVVTHQLNDPAAPSPVTDGENVYVFFEDAGLASYSSEGDLRWKVDLGPASNLQGLGASPVLSDGLLILQVDRSENSYIAAFRSANGNLAWKVGRVEADSWTTPVIQRFGEGARILTVSDGFLGAHDLSNGQRKLTAPEVAGYMIASPVLAGDVLFALGYNLAKPPSFDGPLSKMDANGDGKLDAFETRASSFHTGLARSKGNRDGVLERHEYDEVMAVYSGPSRLAAVRLGEDGSAERLWSYERSFVGVIPAPLVLDGTLFHVKNGGILTAMDASTGEVVKQGRLREASDGYSASPVAAEGRIYFASEAGKISVVTGGADWRVVSVADLGEEIYATPALSEGDMFVRTNAHLYRLGK